jgi:glycosyltransferase involved in cell wall biosynthesis
MASVSVVMASYNGRRHIRRQLDSLAAQRCLPAELVVTDDRSDDDTASVVVEFGRTAPFRVRLYRNEQRVGYRGNFMRGLELCESDLVAFCDQDDWWYPNKLEACVACFDDPEIALVYHNADVVTEDGRVIGSLDRFAPGHGIIPSVATRALMANPYGLTLVFRRSLFDYARLWPTSLDHNWAGEPMAHDQWAYFMACVLGSVAYVDERLAAYVQHGSNAIGWRGRRAWSTRLRSVFENHAEEYRRYAAAAARRAEILDLVQTERDPSLGVRAATAAEQLRALSRLFAQRSDIYAGRGICGRITAFWGVLAQGGYRHDLGLSCKSLCKDATLGVVAGPLLARPELG